MARPTNPLESFFWGAGGQPMTEEEIAREREIAQLLTGQVDTSPVGHWTQGAARMAQALAGRVREGRANRASGENADYNRSIIESLFSPSGGTTAPVTAAPAPSGPPTPATSALMRGTGGGQADAITPVVSSPIKGEWINYANQGATRSLPLNEKLTQALSFLPDLGVSIEVFSGGQPGKGSGLARIGSTRHDHGNAADVFFVKDGRRLNWANEADRPIFEEIVRRGKQAGLTGFGAGPGYMREGSMHIGFGSPGVWGAGGRAANAPDWLRNAFNGAPAGNSQVASLDPSIGLPDQQTAGLFVGTPDQMPPATAPVPQPRTEMTAQAMPAQMMDPQGMGGPAQGFVMPQGMPQQAPAPAPQPAQAPGIDPRIIQALSDPRVDGNTKRIAAMLLQQQQAQQQAFAEQQALQNDPLRQLQIQKGQLELEAMRNPQPKYEFTTGKDGSIFRTDQAGNIEQVYGGKPDRPVDVQEYEYAVEQMRAAGMPADQIPDYTTWSTGQKRAGASQVNIDQRAEGAFEKKLAETQATTFDTMATEGLNSRADLALIDELGGLLEGQGGVATGLAGWAAQRGFDIGEGTSDLQAAQAIISRLVPTQRQPGSGSMSDRDVELFRASLPSLWNQPGGNQRIISVMRGLAQYKAAQGEIADSVLAGEMTRQEARRALRELPNPLEGIGKKEEKPISEMTDEELEAIANGNR